MSAFETGSSPIHRAGSDPVDRFSSSRLNPYLTAGAVSYTFDCKDR